MTARNILTLCGLALALAVPALTATLTLDAVADTSLFQPAPDNNLGSSSLAIGVTNSGSSNLSRSLVRFDLTSVLPADAVIEAVSLSLVAKREARTSGTAMTLRAHRALVFWQEGNGTGNTGAAAQVGDATWNQRAPGQANWGTPGGLAGVDFVASASALTNDITYGYLGTVDFDSTQGLIDDVNYWLTNPAANFGYFLMAADESTPASARRFASTEEFTQGLSPDPVFPPRLTITYSAAIPEPSSYAAIAGALGLGMAFYRRRCVRR